MKLALQAGVAIATLIAGNAWATNADAETYGVIRAGVNDADASAFGTSFAFNQGQSIEGAIGVDMGSLRLEAGASRDNADLGLVGIEANLTNYSATALVDFSGPLGLTYSAGAGLDYSEVEANLGFASIEGSGDGWHYDLAASSNINDRWSLEVRRRAYSGTVDIEGLDVDVDNVAWTLGIRRAL